MELPLGPLLDGQNAPDLGLTISVTGCTSSNGSAYCGWTSRYL